MNELRRRLGRLGVTTGRDFVPQPRPYLAGIEQVAGGTIHETEDGPGYRILKTYPAGTTHGLHALTDWLAQDRATVARIGGDTAIRRADLRRFVFLDTETTGLGGAGTLAFLVGIGLFDEGGALQIHQFFLRDPSEERAMLRLLHDAIWPDGGLVTFNGRSFDVPLLADRYVISRMRSHLPRLPNLDLLPPARRLWKRRLPSCRLAALEVDVLGLRRSGADVPGWLIPALYQQYLRTGDASDIGRVLYHNEQDILSMVSLAVTLCRAFEQPEAPAMPVDDRLSLARWYQQHGLIAECEAAYRAAVEGDSDGETRSEALFGLAALLKRSGRSAEAVPLWEYLADLKLDTAGHEALAKHYEWQVGDLPRALAWTDGGIALARTWRPGLHRTEVLRALEHRRARLLRKSGASTDSTERHGEKG